MPSQASQELRALRALRVPSPLQPRRLRSHRSRVHVFDGVGPLVIFFRNRDDFRNKNNIKIPVKKNRLGRFKIARDRDRDRRIKFKRNRDRSFTRHRRGGTSWRSSSLSSSLFFEKEPPLHRRTSSFIEQLPPSSKNNAPSSKNNPPSSKNPPFSENHALFFKKHAPFFEEPPPSSKNPLFLIFEAENRRSILFRLSGKKIEEPPFSNFEVENPRTPLSLIFDLRPRISNNPPSSIFCFEEWVEI